MPQRRHTHAHVRHSITWLLFRAANINTLDAQSLYVDHSLANSHSHHLGISVLINISFLEQFIRPQQQFSWNCPSCQAKLHRHTSQHNCGVNGSLSIASCSLLPVLSIHNRLHPLPCDLSTSTLTQHFFNRVFKVLDMKTLEPMLC